MYFFKGLEISIPILSLEAEEVVEADLYIFYSQIEIFRKSNSLSSLRNMEMHPKGIYDESNL